MSKNGYLTIFCLFFGFNAALVAIGIVMMAGAIASADAIGL